MEKYTGFRDAGTGIHPFIYPQVFTPSLTTAHILSSQNISNRPTPLHTPSPTPAPHRRIHTSNRPASHPPTPPSTLTRRTAGRLLRLRPPSTVRMRCTQPKTTQPGSTRLLPHHHSYQERTPKHKDNIKWTYRSKQPLQLPRHHRLRPPPHTRVPARVDHRPRAAVHPLAGPAHRRRLRPRGGLADAGRVYAGVRGCGAGASVPRGKCGS